MESLVNLRGNINQEKLIAWGILENSGRYNKLLLSLGEEHLIKTIKYADILSQSFSDLEVKEMIVSVSLQSFSGGISE